MSTVRYKGIDSFDYKPGEVNVMWCQACGAVCEVDRNVMGPTGYAEAMGRRGHLHDYFYCPNSGRPWHDQAVELLEALEETPSNSLKQLIRKDLEEIKAKNGCGPYPQPDMEELLKNGQVVYRLDWDSGAAGMGADFEQVVMYRWKYYVLRSDQDESEVAAYDSMEEALQNGELLELNESCTAITSDWPADMLIPMLTYTGEVETRIRINGKEYRALPDGIITA